MLLACGRYCVLLNSLFRPGFPKKMGPAFLFPKVSHFLGPSSLTICLSVFQLFPYLVSLRLVSLPSLQS